MNRFLFFFRSLCSHKLCLVVLTLCVCSLSYAQNEASSKQLWFDYNPSYYISKKSVLLGDVSYRKQLNLEQWNQIVVRPGYRYVINPTFSLNAGLGYFGTYVSGLDNENEIRFYQGVKVRFPSFFWIVFKHYLRLEERIFLSDKDKQLRFRYQLIAELFLVNKGKCKVTLPLSGELFGDTSPEDDDLFNKERERYFIGLGYQFRNEWKVQFTFNIQGLGESLGDLDRTDTMFRFRFFHFLKTRSDYNSIPE